MTEDQINGYIRTLCTILGTLSGTGLAITAGQIGTIQSGLLGISSLVFLGFSIYGSWKAHSAAGIATAADRSMTPAAKAQIAATVPGTTVVTTPAIANATPELNVVSRDAVQVVPVNAPSLGTATGVTQ